MGQCGIAAALQYAGGDPACRLTPVLRGCVFEPRFLSVSQGVEAAFGLGEISRLLRRSLCGPALDRQHPRERCGKAIVRIRIDRALP
jgi:hypothetical protein